MVDRSRTADALDLFEGESRLLEVAFKDWEDPDGDRFVHETIGKFLLEHLVIREAARSAIVNAIGGSPADPLVAFVRSDRAPMRDGLRRLTALSEGVSAGEMNFGQDFDGEIARLQKFYRADRDTSLPLQATGTWRQALPSARHVRRHAPSRLSSEPNGWERIAPLVRCRALYDHLRRLPTPARYRLPAHLKEAERALP